MSLLSLLLALALCAGHVALCTWVYNRLHASRLPSRHVQRLEKWVILATLATLLGLLAWVVQRGQAWMDVDTHALSWLLLGWRWVCWSMLAYVVAAWMVRQWARRAPGRLTATATQCLDVAQIVGFRPIGDALTRLWGTLPGNQILHLHAQHKMLRVAQLPAALEGLRIAQLSDLHMTGRLTREFYHVAVDHVLQWQPDLILLTGDLFDTSECLAWVPDTLGRLACPFGVYAILGNHDQRLPDAARVRQTLTDNGLEDLGGRCVERAVRGVPVLLAGNEVPWFPPAPRVAREAIAACPFSILLSHSPDQLPWARRHGFHLMLAGHTHGGQIRIPVLGPIICPSRYGVRYASGLFDCAPTLLHVSRGLSGVHPLRFNCPPELTLLELHRG